MKKELEQLKGYVKTHKKEILITTTVALGVVGAGFGSHKIFSKDKTVSIEDIDLDKFGPMGKLIEAEQMSKFEYMYTQALDEETITLKSLGEFGEGLVNMCPDLQLTDEITGLLVMTK